eukprot:3878759-Rhodomonas_salina.1
MIRELVEKATASYGWLIELKYANSGPRTWTLRCWVWEQVEDTGFSPALTHARACLVYHA